MIVLGRIAAPFGVHGWVKVQVFGDDPQAWALMPHWWLGAEEQAADAADGRGGQAEQGGVDLRLIHVTILERR